jgi:hypothetical protein
MTRAHRIFLFISPPEHRILKLYPRNLSMQPLPDMEKLNGGGMTENVTLWDTTTPRLEQKGSGGSVSLEIVTPAPLDMEKPP